MVAAQFPSAKRAVLTHADELQALAMGAGQHTATRNRAGSPTGVRKPQRKVYDASFKLMVVEQALKLPPDNRIKPTCRAYPGIEPVQVRKWIRNYSALQMAQPTAKVVQRARLELPRTPSPPDLGGGDSSETESVASTPGEKRPRCSTTSGSRGAGKAAAPKVAGFPLPSFTMASPGLTGLSTTPVGAIPIPQSPSTCGEEMRAAAELMAMLGGGFPRSASCTGELI